MIINNGFRGHQPAPAFTGAKERKFIIDAVTRQEDWQLINSINAGAFRHIPEEDVNHPDVVDAFTRQISQDQKDYPDFEEAGQGFQLAFELLLRPFQKK